MDSSINILQKKIQDTPALANQFKENEKFYQTKLQVAKYSQSLEILKKHPPVIYAGKDKLSRHVFYITAMLIPDSSNKVEYEQWLLFFVSTFEEKMGDKQFIIVFFNTNLMTHSRLSDFKDLMGLMPLKYYQKLEAIIVMHANFLVKSGHFFGSSDILSFIKKKIEFIDSLNLMSKQTWFDYSLIDKFPADVKKYDNSYKDILKRQTRTLTKLNNQLKTGGTVVNVPLSDDDEEEFDKNTKILGHDLTYYETNTHKFPILLDILIQYFTQNQQYLLHEGIFRKQAAVYEERILEAAIANKKLKFIQRIEDPHIVSGLFKQFFIQLPTPIVTFEVYKQILDQTQGKIPKDPQDQIKLCQMIVSSIPTVNKTILGVCLGFFKKVVFFEDHNKMSIYNLAVVFAPCFFRAPQLTMMDLVNAQFFVSLLQILITEFHQFYPEFDYRTFLTCIVDNKRQSLVPYLPDDTANMQDLMDMMLSDFKFTQMDDLECDDEESLPGQQLDKAKLDQLVGLGSDKVEVKQFTPRSSIASGKNSSQDDQL